MDKKKLLLEYLRKFRLECHYRLDMAPSDFKELPIYIYEGAHREARKEMLSEYELDSSYSDSFNQVYSFFEKTIVEKDSYCMADQITIEAIENGFLY